MGSAKMVDKKFYLSAPRSIQEIGMRAQIVSFLISHGITAGNAINDPDNNKQVIVAVRAENDNKINEIRDELVAHLNKLSQNDLCYSEFPKDITATKIMDLSNPHPVVVLELGGLSDGLMLEQTSKGAGAMKQLVKVLEHIDNTKFLH